MAKCGSTSPSLCIPWQTDIHSDTYIDAEEIIPGKLWLGSEAAAGQVDLRNFLGITHILTIMSKPLPRKPAGVCCKFVELYDDPSDDLLEVLEECVNFVDSAVNDKSPTSILSPTFAGNAHNGFNNSCHGHTTGPIMEADESLSDKETSTSSTTRTTSPSSRDHSLKFENHNRVLVHCSAGISRSPSVVMAWLITRRGKSFEEAFEMVKRCRPYIMPNEGFERQLILLAKHNGNFVKAREAWLASVDSPDPQPDQHITTRLEVHNIYQTVHSLEKQYRHSLTGTNPVHRFRSTSSSVAGGDKGPALMKPILQSCKSDKVRVGGQTHPVCHKFLFDLEALKNLQSKIQHQMVNGIVDSPHSKPVLRAAASKLDEIITEMETESPDCSPCTSPMAQVAAF